MKIRNDGIEGLLRRSEGKKLACFGAGYYLNWLCESFEFLNFWDRIDYILDNSAEKQGSLYQFNGKSRRIIAPETCFEECPGHKLVVVISTMYFFEFFERMNNDARLKDAECYLFTLLDAAPPHYEFPAHEGRELKIPKTLHYCWFSGEPIPGKYLEYIDTWRKYCPDYKIIKWTRENYDSSGKGYINQCFEKKKWSAASDYSRLDIIYNYGGIYLDMDIEIVKSLDSLLYNTAFCGFQNMNEVNFGSGFGAVKGFPLLKELLDDYDNTSFINSDGTLNDIPCPVYQTDMLLRHGLKSGNRLQIIDNMTVYPTDVLAPKNCQNGLINITENTYSIHHYDGTWTDSDAKESRDKFILCVNEFIKLAVKEVTQ